MIEIPIILVTLIIGLILIGVLIAIILWKHKSEEESKKEPNYLAFFIFGICILPMGIVFSTAVNPGFIGFIGLGIAYMAIGLVNRDKWKK